MTPQFHNNLALRAIVLLVCLQACGDDESSRLPDAPAAVAGFAGTQSSSGGGSFERGGASGSDGTVAKGGTGAIGGKDVDATSGAGGTPIEEPIPVSKFCGDAIRGEFDEQCDDGPGSEADLCSAECKITDALAVLPADTPVTRVLGTGRHPLSASAKGSALAFIEPDAKPPTIGVAFFDQHGKRMGITRAGSAKNFVSSAGPVTAALQDGSFALAWTDIDGDGDQLGVALRKVTPSSDGAASHQYANETRAFSQSRPDTIWTESELIVAWVDNSNAETGPDLMYRRFDANLAPLSSEQPLAATAAAEADVALAKFAGGWAAAWRQGQRDGSSEIAVRTGSTSWTIGVAAPGGEEDVPALVELDATHVLVVFTERTNAGTEDSNVSRLRGVIVDTNAVGAGPVFEINPQREEATINLTIAQGQPALARVGDTVFLAWRSGTLSSGGTGQELWLKELTWSSTDQILNLSQTERSILQTSNNRGDQRALAFASTPLIPKGALFTAWEDYGANLDADQGRIDIGVQLAPKPASLER